MKNDELSIDHPPRGIRMEQTLDGGIAIRVRMFGLISFVMFFATVLCIGAVLILAGGFRTMLAKKYGWTLPDGLPLHSGIDANVIPTVFIFFFLALGIWMVWLTVFYFFGQCVVRLSYNEGSVFTGIGSFGRTRRFSPKSVKMFMANSVATSEHDEKVTTQYQLAIKTDDGHEIKFPMLYDRMQERWLLFALRKILDRKTPTDIII